MFQFPSLASGTYVFSDGSRGFAAGGFPIRKSPGQSLFSGSPKLIAAYHVLHRLSLPRHPPYALSSLTIKKANLINTAVHTSRNGSRHFGATYKSLYAIVKERKPKARSTFYVLR